MTKLPIFTFIIAGLLILVSLCVFTVDEREKAIVLQFGNPVSVVHDAGLKIKLPWPIQDVRYFDARILDVDPAPQRMNVLSDGQAAAKILNADGQQQTPAAEIVSGEPIIVDPFARYRISDPLLFLQRLGSEAIARQQIENVMDSATRNALGKVTLRELLSSKRGQVMQQISDRVNAEMKPRGVEIVDVRIVRADLTDRLRSSTVNRMITERKELATQTRAKGQEKALEIKSTADKDRQVILANANRDAQITKGDGDKQATEIYNKAYNKDSDFYAFIRSMQAYETSLGGKDTKMILSPDSAFLKYLSEKK